jgi:hypothetical protein
VGIPAGQERPAEPSKVFSEEAEAAASADLPVDVEPEADGEE